VYAEILKTNRGVMTPLQVKEELEQQGMTFLFVEQDMVAMRLMPFVTCRERGQYQWNANFGLLL
jgi:hypothetical protein